MFVYQSTLDTLELKKDRGIDYVFSWKSKGIYTSKLKPFCTAYLRSIKVAGYKVRKVFDKDPLAVEQNNYETKIAIAYVVCDLGTWRNNPLRNFA